MNLLNLGASFGASTFAVCMGGFCLMMAVTLAVTIYKCAIRPLAACVHKARYRASVRPRELSWGEMCRARRPRHLI